MTAHAFAQINLAALQHNLQRVTAYAPQVRIMAMVKANAYGHGLLPVAQALAAADGFGVACLEEALLLRRHQITCPIVVMSGFLDADELQQMAQHSISAVVHTRQQVQLLQTAILPKPLAVWLKADVGMHRLGFPIHEIVDIYRQLNACHNVKPPVVVLTHFAQADELDQLSTTQQMNNFYQTIDPTASKSLANSATILRKIVTDQDWVRPGIMLYGLSPFAERVGSDFGLQPVMTLQSRLIATHELAKNETVGYGATWRCPEAMPIGVAAIGYGDGYPRHAKNGTPVLVNGVRCALVGRVSMDLITIDLRNCPQSKIGDSVILWGDGLPIEEVARSADTIGYELLCHVTARVKFEYI